MNPRLSALVLVAVLLAATTPASAWGRVGHRLVAELALKDLPPEVRTWLKGHERTFLEHSSDPDTWRRDRKEAPWKWLQESNALVLKVLEDDRAADRTRPRGKRRGQAYWKRY